MLAALDLRHTLYHIYAIALVLLSLCPTFTTAQANRTIDDFSPQIIYSPASGVTHTNLTGFDITKLYNGTIGVMNGTAAAVNMTLKFTGTAIWLFLAKPETKDTFVTGYTIFLDGAEVNDAASVDENTDPEYGSVGYSNDKLQLGPHIVTLQATEDPVYFDYAVFTSNNPNPETTIPPVQPPPSSASSSASPAKNTNAHSSGSAPPQPSAASLKTKPRIALYAGVAAAAILVLGSAIAFLCIRSRRRAAGPVVVLPQQQYTSRPPQYPHPGGLTQQQQQQGMYGAQTSEAALLHPSDLNSALSISQHSSASSFPSPQSDQQHNFYTINNQASQYQPYPPQINTQFSIPYAPNPTSSLSSSSAYPPSATADSSHRPHSHTQLPYQPDPFAYQGGAEMQRVMAEQHAVEAEYAAPAVWVVNEKGVDKQSMYRDGEQQYGVPSQTLYPHPQQQRYQNAGGGGGNLERVMEKHRVAEEEYADGRRLGQKQTQTQGWERDEKPLQTHEHSMAYGNSSSNTSSHALTPSQSLSPSRSHSNASARTNWDERDHDASHTRVQGHTPDLVETYPPTPSSPGSSSAHGEAAISTIAAQMAQLRAQVARLEGERREEAPPAYV
ncbi:hypothetical protein R3P38DRAFT_2911038 [Favolaschia claudopus]|uniref:Uncharacterized protein n=1 Tax=Favolaschia claudopus TaxID=2862362 RepID=A0AAW0CCP0_9AGAR